MRNMKEEYQRIGKRIRMMRLKQGMSQMEFAKRLGIVQAGLSAMEHGKQPTTLKRLFQMSDVLGCEMSDFFEEEKPAKNDISLEEVVEAMQIVRKIKLAKADENFSTGKEIPSVVKKHSRVERKYKEVIKP